MLPPSVFVGNIVNFIGRFVTYNEGRDFFVVDALPFKAKFQDVVRPVQNHILSQCEDPREWLEGIALDRLLIKDVNSPGE